GQLLDQVVEEPAHRLGVELRVHLRAAELALRRIELEAALQLVQLRGLQLAGEAGSTDLRADLQVLGHRAVGLLAPAGGHALDQPRAIKHPHVEMEVPGIDRQPLGQIAVRQRLVRLAEHLEHLEPKRMAERLQLLRPVDVEDVARARLCLDRRLHGRIFAAAAPSDQTSIGTDASRKRLAGTSRVISPPKAPATASALSAPATWTTIRRDDRIAGIVIVTRSTHGSSPAGPLVARWFSTSSCGEPGNSEATWPSGPRP